MQGNPYGKIEEVNESKQDKILFDTVSGTTDLNGDISTLVPINTRYIISGRYDMAGANGGVLPMIYKAGNFWYFHCYDTVGGNLANTSVTIKYAYI